MDIDTFLDRELKVVKKEESEKKKIEEVKEEQPKLIHETEKDKDLIPIYLELWNKISDAKFEWDEKLYTELDETKRRIKDSLDRLSYSIEREKTAIRNLIDKAMKELEKRNHEAALRLYADITDMRNNMPDFLIEEKREINREIFRLYDKLHDKIDLKFINNFKESITKVDVLVRKAFSSFDKGATEDAKNYYKKALEIYKSLPNGFMFEKIELGNGLLVLYKNLSIAAEIKDLQNHLGRESIKKYNYAGSDYRLNYLAEAIKHPKNTNGGVEDENVLERIISRKLDAARLNIKQGYYLEAKKDIESVLKMDPANEDAKKILKTINL